MIRKIVVPLSCALALALSACTGSDSLMMTEEEQNFFQDVATQAQEVPDYITSSDEVDPAVRDLVKELDSSSDRLAEESSNILKEVGRQVEANETAKAAVEGANETIDKTVKNIESETEAREWLEELIKERERLIAQAQEQIDTSDKTEIVNFAKRVKKEQTDILSKLKQRLETLENGMSEEEK